MWQLRRGGWVYRGAFHNKALYYAFLGGRVCSHSKSLLDCGYEKNKGLDLHGNKEFRRIKAGQSEDNALHETMK
jgi:hypothetical protein